jgi:protein translocase SecG subunit
MDALRVILLVLHALVSVVLIALVVSQTARSEGLGAVGGSSSGPSLRGRAGLDEKLSEYTRYAAFSFMILSLVLYLLAQKFGELSL